MLEAKAERVSSAVAETECCMSSSDCWGSQFRNDSSCFEKAETQAKGLVALRFYRVEVEPTTDGSTQLSNRHGPASRYVDRGLRIDSDVACNVVVALMLCDS